MNKFLSTIQKLGQTVLVMALLLQLFSPASAAAPESGGTGLFSRAPEAGLSRGAEADREVSIIVELEDGPLLEGYETQAYTSVREYLASAAGQARADALAVRRSETLAALEKKGLEVAVEYEYSAVLSGFALTARYGDLAAIRATAGVKNAFVAGTYAAPEEPEECEPQLSGSVGTIGAKDLGYTGQGTVVAILDTGLDLAHEAFQGAVTGARVDELDIQNAINNYKLAVGKIAASALYHGEKIPFAYDYADKDIGVKGPQAHGTHVAGIVGANAGEVRGVAPDAQLMIMKVFGDASGGASDENIMAALDDAVKLGVDAVNMSLGSPAGYYVDGEKVLREAYQRVRDAGVALTVSAGNSYSAAFNGESGNDLSYVTNPDNSVVSSPSSYGASLSVASANNARTLAPYLLVGDRQVRYNDAAEQENNPPEGIIFSRLSGEFEYVVCGYGATTDFAGKNLKGKIALIQRGGMENGANITFAAKEENAAAAGATAAVVYDNVVGDLIYMSSAGMIPCVFISKADGEFMAAAADKHLIADAEQLDYFSDSSSGRMSDFSSWGMTPELKLKPEITAPGGDIYSTLPNNRYGNMSGTSMAAPHLAGCEALMAQYLDQYDSNMTKVQRAELATDLLMSTASPIKDANGNFYSPRKQGAGLVQVNRAVKAKAYLTGSDGGRPVGNTGASEQGAFSFSFRANRMSGATDAIRYDVEVSVLTESVVTEDGQAYMAQESRPLTAQEVTVTAPASVTLDRDSVDVSVALALTDAGKKSLEVFPNGIYIEGFVTLTPTSGDDIPLVIPFAGFYGDWSAAPAFDRSIYEEEPANIAQTVMGFFDNYTGGGYYLGKCYYTDDGVAPIVDARRMAIKGRDASFNVTAACALLRNADELTFAVTDGEGNEVYSESIIKTPKTYFADTAFYTPMAPTGWITKDSWGEYLPDGTYTYTVSSTVAGRTQKLSYPIEIDTQRPEVLSSEVVGTTWKVTVRDNHYISALCASATGSAPLTGWINPQESEPGASTVVEFDLTDPAFKGLTQARIAIVDYADNQTVTEYYPLTGGGAAVAPTGVSLNKTSCTMTVGDTVTLAATVTPQNATNRTVSWTSSNDAVAAVSKNGTVTAKSVGTATVTATTVNGLKAGCTVTVEAAPVVTRTARASITAPGVTAPGEDVTFALHLSELERVATVSFTLEKDAALTGGTAVGKNGFTVVDALTWNGNEGTLMLSYLAGGAGGSLTTDALTELADITFQTGTGQGLAGVTITGVTVSGYDAEGKTVYLASEIKTPRAQTFVGTNPYDVNGDGTVDLLDVTWCQRYYQSASTDPDWAQAQACDFNGDGIVDTADLMLIYNAFTA